MIIEVIIDIKTSKLNELYSYKVPENLKNNIQKGSIVEVIFHNSKRLGIVINIFEDEAALNISDIELLEINNVIDIPNLITTDFFDNIDYIQTKTNISYNLLLLNLIPSVILKKLRNNKKIINTPCIINKNNINISRRVLIKEKNNYLFLNKNLDSKIETIKNIILTNNKSMIILFNDIFLLEQYYSKLKNNFNVIKYHPYIRDSEKTTVIYKYINDTPDIVLTTKELLYLKPYNNYIYGFDLNDINTFNKYEDFYFDVIDYLNYLKDKYNSSIVSFSNTPNISYTHNVKKENIIINDELNRNFFNIIKTKYNLISNTLNEEILKKIDDALSNNKKIIIYNARNNDSLFIYCKSCRNILKCKNCNISLKYSSNKNIIYCPSCHIKENDINTCNKCKSHDLLYIGAGKEKVHKELSKLYKDKKIYLIDNFNYNKLHKTLKDFDIIIGSKSLLKDFIVDKDNLIICMNLELDLLSNFYNQNEITYQIISLLSSKSNNPVEIILENINNELFNNFKLSYFDFYKKEICNKKILKLPPIYNNYQILLSSFNSYLNTYKEINFIKQELESINLNVLGPNEVYSNNFKFDKYNFYLTVKVIENKIDDIKNLIKFIKFRKETTIRFFTKPIII